MRPTLKLAAVIEVLALLAVLLVPANAIQQGDGREPPNGRDVETVVVSTEGEAARLVVKVDPSQLSCLDCGAARKGQLAGATGSLHLDELNRRYAVHRIRPLRRAFARLRSVEARRQLQSVLRNRLIQRARLSKAGELPDFTSVYVFELGSVPDIEEAVRAYENVPGVVYAEPDSEVAIQLVPDDPFFSSSGSWGQPFDDLWGIGKIAAPAAWDTARGAGVVVAVIDTGLDTAHPDLTANVWSNPGEIPGNEADDDGNGYVDDVLGWNFYSDSADITDDHGHGTHVAGTVAATGNNTLGVIGVAFEAQVMGIKGLSAGGGGFSSDLADAILYATENGAQVINASWGGSGESQILEDAVRFAHDAGVVVVASAGNSNIDIADGPFFPAAYRETIAVAAFDHLDQKASFSNFGAKIDVAAPGGGDSGTGFEPDRSILSLLAAGAGSTMTGNGRLIVDDYLRQAGTSMAAPHVAGGAAVILSLHPEYTPVQVRQALRAGADDIDPPGFDPVAGYGRINLERAVLLDALDVDIQSPATGAVIGGFALDLVGTAGGAGFASYTVEYGGGALPSSWIPIAGPLTTPVQDGTLYSWDVSGVPDGDYVIRLRAENGDGDSFEDRIAVTLDRVMISDPFRTILRPSGPLEIRGSAAGGDFQRFRVEWRIVAPDFSDGPWRQDGISLTGGGASPVFDEVLATFDTSLITENTYVDFRVVVERSSDEVADEGLHVIIDPTLRAGFPVQLDGFLEFDENDRLLHHLTVADLDADGSKEILVSYGDGVSVYRDDGSVAPGWPRSFDAPPPLLPPKHLNRRSPAAADLDGDGLLEVVARAGLYIYIWHADGTPMAGWPKKFRLPPLADQPETYPDSGGPRGDFVLADVDGNGERDIVTVIGHGIYVIDRNGDPLPGWPQLWPPEAPCISRRCFESLLAVGDTDGDGTMEIAAVTSAKIVKRFGDIDSYVGNAQSLLLYAADGTLMPRFPRRFTSLHYGDGFNANHLDGHINGPVMADLDGDGDLEIIVMGSKTRVRAFHHTGRRISVGPRATGTRFRCGRTSFQATLDPITAGDLDGDGRAEVLASAQTRKEKWRPSGGGNITLTLCLTPTINGVDYINVMGNRGPKRSGWPVAFPYPKGDSSYGPGSVAIADLDGDLLPEVISASGICGFWVPGTFSLRTHRCFPIYAFDRFGSVLPGFPKATVGPGTLAGTTPAVADLDGDGLKEIAFIDFAGNLLVWTIPGTPAPEAPQWSMFRGNAAHTGTVMPASP